MKKSVRYGSILLAGLLMLSVFTACAKQKQEQLPPSSASDTLPVETLSPDTDGEPVETTPDTEPVDTEEAPSVREPIENERAQALFEYQYALARTAYAWGTQANMALDTTTEAAFDGHRYYRVNDPTTYAVLGDEPIDSYADLETYIRSLFAQNIADDLMRDMAQHYRDVDGILYGEEFSETRTTVLEGGTAFLYEVSSRRFGYTSRHTASGAGDGGEAAYVYYDFIFENDGTAWLWTSFPLYGN